MFAYPPLSLQVLFPLLTNLIETVNSVKRPTCSTGTKHQPQRGGDQRSVGALPPSSSSGQSSIGPSFFSNIFGGSGSYSSDKAFSSSPSATSGTGMNPAEYTDPRIRTIPLLTKVFLQHLSQLYALDSFPIIWNRILGYMQRYLQADISDSLVRSSMLQPIFAFIIAIFQLTTQKDNVGISQIPEPIR